MVKGCITLVSQRLIPTKPLSLGPHLTDPEFKSQRVLCGYKVTTVKLESAGVWLKPMHFREH